MKNRLLLALIALALLVPLVALAAPLSDGAGEPVTSPNYRYEGYVVDTAKKPMGGVTVTIAENRLGGIFEKGVTNEDGLFSIVLASSMNLKITFEIRGYRIISCPNTVLQPDGTLTLNLSTAQYNSAARIYTLTTDKDGMQPAIMSATFGTISGIVSYEKGAIKDMIVSIKVPGADNNYREARTNDSGFYEIKDCPIGSYLITAGGQGFNQSEYEEVNITSSGLTKNITLIKSDLPKYLGSDLAHILMLVGVIVGMFLAAAAWFLSKRMNEPHHIEVFDDTVEEEGEIKAP